MSAVSMQEIKTKKRSLREVLPPKNISSRPAISESVNDLPADDDLPPIKIKHYNSGSGRSGGGKKRWLWFGGLIIVILVIAFFISQAWARVTVEVVPFSIDLTLDETVDASRAGGELTFSTITLPAKTGGKLVKATGTEKVSRQASGQIVIYNNYDKNVQKLVANTRFETKEGKIYKIHEPVSVPGMKTVSGKAVPGTVEVTVYADKPGPAGNGPATDFTIPGFKGDPRFTKFFARSKTPLAGGIVGEVPKLSAEEETRARVALRADLTKELLKEARFKIPETQVLFDGTTLVDFQDATDWQAATAESVLIKESAILNGIMLPRQAFSNKLIDTKVSNFSPAELQIADLESLPVSLDLLKLGNLSEAKEITLSVKGSTRLIAVINNTDIAAKLAGAKQDEIDGVLAQIKSIAKAKVSFRPPWVGQVPADPEAITIKLDENNDSLLH